MKKILLAALAAALMSTSAMALDGTITKIVITSGGVAQVFIGTIKKNIGDISTDAGKAMFATALTAKASGDPVEAYHDGTNWTILAPSNN